MVLKAHNCTNFKDGYYTVFWVPPPSNLPYAHVVKFIIEDSTLI